MFRFLLVALTNTNAIITDTQDDFVAFLGPLVGAMFRPVGGWLADKMGGARVTFFNFIVMAAATIGVIVFLPKDGTGGRNVM